MISAVHEKRLIDIFFLISAKPGWLADCVDAGFDKEEIEILEKAGQEFLSYAPEREITAWVKSIEREGGPEIYSAENDDEKIKMLSREIAGIYRDYEKSMWADEPYQERALMLVIRGVERLEKLRRGIRGRQLHTQEKAAGVVSDRITDQDIESARGYPLERLIPDFDMARAGYIECRWHEDKKPSMLVKNGFGYCFACAKSIDSIGWLMDVDRMGFIDAVKFLRGKSV